MTTTTTMCPPPPRSPNPTSSTDDVTTTKSEPEPKCKNSDTNPSTTTTTTTTTGPPPTKNTIETEPECETSGTNSLTRTTTTTMVPHPSRSPDPTASNDNSSTQSEPDSETSVMDEPPEISSAVISSSMVTPPPVNPNPTAPEKERPKSKIPLVPYAILDGVGHHAMNSLSTFLTMVPLLTNLMSVRKGLICLAVWISAISLLSTLLSLASMPFSSSKEMEKLSFMTLAALTAPLSTRVRWRREFISHYLLVMFFDLAILRYYSFSKVHLNLCHRKLTEKFLKKPRSAKRC